MASRPGVEIRLDDLTVEYGGHPAVHHLSGTFRAGSLTAIMGPNGAGKSSLLKALAGLKSISTGAIDRQGLSPRAIGYLPQQAEIDRSFPISVRDFVALGEVVRVGLFRSIPQSAIQRAISVLNRVGLAGFEHRGLSELSIGQFQRVLFARLMMQDAPVQLLDEPFNALDSRTTNDLVAMVREWQTQGRTTIIVLHDRDLALSLCPDSLVIARNLVAWGPSEQALAPEIMARAQNMAEAWDDHAPVCAPDARDHDHKDHSDAA